MKRIILSLLTIWFSIFLNAQSIIKLPYENPKGLTWTNAEKEYFFDAWKTKIITNISVPKQNLHSDKWIEQFYDWAIAEGFVTVKK